MACVVSNTSGIPGTQYREMIERFDPYKIAVARLSLVIGRRAVGTTTLLNDLMHRFDGTSQFYICEFEHRSSFKDFPDAMVRANAGASWSDSEITDHSRAVRIIDECLVTPAQLDRIRPSDNIRTIIGIQYDCSRRALHEKADYAFMFREPVPLMRKKLYERYGHHFATSLQDFEHILDGCTKGHECLVFDRMRSKAYRYKASTTNREARIIQRAFRAYRKRKVVMCILLTTAQLPPDMQGEIIRRVFRADTM